jgi:dynein heavy chain 2
MILVVHLPQLFLEWEWSFSGFINCFLNNSLYIFLFSDEDTDVKAVVKSWLSKEPAETRSLTEQLINEYFFDAFNWIIKQGDFVVETTLIGTVLNGLSHLHSVHDRSLFTLGLIRGLGGNLNEKTRETFAREVCEENRHSFSA